MQFADLHLHSSYSRATSKNITLGEMARNAKIKGLDILGTGDFTHPVWIKQLRRDLSDEGGIYDYDNIKFILTGEISLVYTQGGKGRRIHHLLLAPDFGTVDQINAFLDKKGRRDYDGRPIFGFSSIELVDVMMSISKDIMVIPAHCLLPNEKVVCNPRIKPISEINIGEKVLTHKGNYKKVTQVFTRKYDGKAYKVQPYYFREGIKVTKEHPFFAIKTIYRHSEYF